MALTVDKVRLALSRVTSPSTTTIRLGAMSVLPATTGEADTELFTSTAHGLAVGDRVMFAAITGGTGLTAGTTYFVKTVPDANSFTLSATLGGATQAISADLTASTAIALKTGGGTAIEAVSLANASDEASGSYVDLA